MQRTRAPGQGTVTELPSGRFRVRVPHADGSRAGGVFDTREEAEGVRRSLVAKLAAANAAPTGSTTFATYGLRRLTQRAADGMASARSDLSLFRTRVEGTTLGATPLVAVTRALVLAWLLAQKASTVKRRSRKGTVTDTGRPLGLDSLSRYRAVIHGTLQDATESGLIPANPAVKIVLAGVDTGKKRESWTYLTRAEIAAVLGCQDVPLRFRWLFTVAIYSGLRRGELWGLRWGDVTLTGERPELHVQRSHDGPTKTGLSRRVPLLPPARAALEQLSLRARDRGPDALVFPTRFGKMRHRNDRGMWGRNGTHAGYRAVAGIARRVPFHALRHTCATALVSGWWGPAWRLEDVQHWLGHSSLQVTQRYAHLCPDWLHTKAAATTCAAPSPESAAAVVRVLRPYGPGDTPANELEIATRNDALCSSTTSTSGAKSGETPGFIGGRVPAVSRDLGGETPSPGRVSYAPLALEACAGVARALLEAVEAGTPAAPLIAALAALAGSDGHPLAHLAARGEGPHRVVRALELADAVLTLARAVATAESAARRG
jgi:integrase